jgi:Uma2 family endonuclease
MQEQQWRYGEQMAARRPATYEDLIEVPEHLVAEIVGGELVTSPRPRPRHAKATSALLAQVYAPFDAGRGGPGGWMIVVEPEVHLGADVLVPDIAGWRRARLPRLPTEAWFPLAPDWICEVLSPSTAALDRGRKLPIYAREGVTNAWLVDPLAQTIEVLRRAQDGWLLLATYTGRQVFGAEPFDSVEIELPLLWAEPESS